jgi:hypothetical protein
MCACVRACVREVGLLIVARVVNRGLQTTEAVHIAFVLVYLALSLLDYNIC